MLIERLLLTIVLALIGLLLYAVASRLHLHQASKASLTKATESGRPTIMYFRSDNCAPCKTQNYFLQDLEHSFGSRLAVHRIDADEDQELAGKFGVFTLPTTLVLDGTGQVQYINYGLTNTKKLARQMEKVI